jgi:pyridoxine 5-phosphate synthase
LEKNILKMTRLSVNINKVATLRNARGENVPDVEAFAAFCEKCGADGITVHPRPDERHITHRDVTLLKEIVTTEFNIEGYPAPEFLDMLEQIKPDQATLVPDAPDAITSSAGWDVVGNEELLRGITARLKAAGIRVSIFVAPDADQIRKAAEIGADRVELYTKAYADNYDNDREAAIKPYVAASKVAHSVGLGVNAGHDLNSKNLSYFKHNIPYLDEVSIGHAMISEALYDGIECVIRRYLCCLQ